MTAEKTKANDSALNEQEKDLRWTRAGVLFFGGIGLLGLGLYALQYVFKDRVALICEVAGSGLLIACASCVLGALLGFIFAIPRALQTQRATDHSDSKLDTERPVLEYQVNTNLEQISDWLTKILVGVSLVQLGQIPGYARRLGNYFSGSLGNSANSSAIVVTLIVAFLVMGFLAGYLITRLYVTGALKRAETEGKVGSPSDITIETRDVQ